MAKTKAAFSGQTFDADPQSELVRVRVTKRGDGRISTGEHDNRGGDILFEAGERFEVARHIAEVHEEHGFVEIEDAEDVARRGPGRPPKAAD